MNTLDLSEALLQIVRTCHRTDQKKKPKPFFFIVGAGISHPSVPLAAEIESHCRQQAHSAGIKADPPTDSPIDRYSHWFGVAYPNAAERQEYLAGLIEGQPITPACLRFAHLLLKRSVANIAVTPNFDDFLFRALTIFGSIDHRICDHPGTVDRINPESEAIQIIQVHGSYWFYDQGNLKGEIEARARASYTTSFTMINLLDHILLNRSPIVVGYSGWDGDVVMTALRRRLTGRLPYRMYWFCYKRAAIQHLPPWLTEHPDIFFVIPSRLHPETSPPLPPPPTSLSESPLQQSVPYPSAPSSAEQITSVPKSLRHRAETEDDEPSLTAQRVFDELIKAFELQAPDLVRNPFDFYAQQLEKSLPHESFEALASDPYSFHSVVRRIRRGEKLEREAVAETEAHLEAVRDSVRRSLYKEAIQRAHEIDITTLDTPQTRELADLLAFAVENVSQDHEAAIAGSTLLVSIADLASKEPMEGIADMVATALEKKAGHLSSLGRLDEAVATLEDMGKRLAGSSEHEVHRELAWAFLHKGDFLRRLGRPDDALKAYDELVDHFGSTSNPAILRPVAVSFYEKGATLSELNRLEEALATFEEAISRFYPNTDDVLLWAVALSLRGKSRALKALGKTNEAIETLDEAVSRFRRTTSDLLLGWVAWALLDKGKLLRDIGRTAEAIASFDEIAKGFLTSSDSFLLMAVAWSLLHKGEILNALGRPKDALAAYDDLLARFQGASDSDLQKRVATALSAKAEIQLQIASSQESTERTGSS